jgi:GTP pyrophosphokinase
MSGWQLGEGMHKQSKLIYTHAEPLDSQDWLTHFISARKHSDKALLGKACSLAELAGKTHTPSWECCLHQGLAMAEILASLKLDDPTLAAAIVYSSVQNGYLTLDDIIQHLGLNVAKLIKGTRRMDAVHSLHGSLARRAHLASTIDNLRKMLLAMVDDVRIVLLKLAERLCILKNMPSNEPKAKAIAKETMEIYAPLANRLGIGHLKWKLEDLSFRHLEPEEYRKLSRGLKDRREDRERYVENFIFLLRMALEKGGIDKFEVAGRAKHIYSIYRKMVRKQVTLNEIYDIIAFRILVSTLDDCYFALGIVHSLWNHIPTEFDDYIIHPKPNGYRSIHTAVLGPDGKHLEIQIRTFSMHQEAELGIAAHWVYKEGKISQTSYEQKIAWLRQVMDWQKEVTETQKESQKIFSHILEDRLYVFTPNGDVIDLPSGSTPLDFAYQIHSELGNRCRGAKINDLIVPLNHTLCSGEKVEILTAKQGHPSRDWLNPHLGYLKTARAKVKVLSWFRKQDYEKDLLSGHDLLEKELKRLGIKKLTYERIAAKLNYKSKEDMFVAIARGDLRMHAILSAIQSMTEVPLHEIEKQPPSLPEFAKSKPELQSADIMIEGVGNLLIYLAKCCKPVPGDTIVGYITVGRGVSIHRENCQNLAARSLLYPERRITVSWGNKILRRYPVDLSIFGDDRPDLIQDITALLANERISVISLNASRNRNKSTIILHITIEVDNLNPLGRLLTRFSQLQGIMAVQRD